MKSLEKVCVRVRAALLGRVPELLLSRVPIHGTDFDEAVPELFRRVVEVARLRTHHGAVIDQAATDSEKEERFRSS